MQWVAGETLACVFEWKRVMLRLSPDLAKRLASARLSLSAVDFAGKVYVTESMLQPGGLVTEWTPSVPDQVQMVSKLVFVIDRDYIDQAGREVGA